MISNTEKMSSIEKEFLITIKPLCSYNKTWLYLKETYDKDEITYNQYTNTLSTIKDPIYKCYENLIELKKYCEFYGDYEKKEWKRIIEKYSFMIKDIDFKKLINKEFKFDIINNCDFTSADNPSLILNERDMMRTISALIGEKKILQDKIEKLQDKIEKLEYENTNLKSKHENIKMNTEDKKVDIIIKWLWRLTYVITFFITLKLLVV